MLNEFLLTVDVELKVTRTLQVDDILTGLLRGEGGLVLGREVLDGQVRSKDVHSSCGHVDGFRIVLGSEGLACHLRVVPESSLQTFLAVGSDAVGGDVAFHHLLVGEVAAGDVDQFLLFGLDTVEDGDGVIRRTVVVTPHHRCVVGIRTDDGDLLHILLQRQDIALVLQEHDTLAGHVEGYLCRCLRTHGGVGDLRPLYERRIVHLTQVETAFEQTDDVLVDLCFRQQTLAHGLGEALIGVVETTLYVGTGKNGFRRTVYGIGR